LEAAPGDFHVVEAVPGDFHVVEAVPGDFHVVAAARAGTHVAAAAPPDGSPVAGEARGGFRVAGEALAVTHAAAAARRAAPAEAAHCAAHPDAIAAEAAAASRADERAAQVLSVEFPADEKAAAVSSAELPGDGYSRAVPVVVLADDCSLAVCPDTGAAAAPAERQMEAGERCDCWALVRCDSPVPRDDHCPPARCEFPEEQGDYQERRAEEHSHYYGQVRCYSVRHYSDQHCWDRQGAVRCGSPERRGARYCSAVLDDSPDRSVDPDDSRRRWAVLDGCLVRCSVDPDDFLAHSVGLGDSRRHSADLDVALHHDCPVHSVVLDDWLARCSAVPDDSPHRSAAPGDWLAHCSAVLDVLQGRLDSDHRGLRVAAVEPELPEPHELFLPEAAQDELHHRDHRLPDDSPDDCKQPADESRPLGGSLPAAAADTGRHARSPYNSGGWVEHG